MQWKLVWVVVSGALLLGCDGEVVQGELGSGGADREGALAEEMELRWLPGESDEARFQALEGQLGGFSQAMIEVGHRYNDLYFAGMDGNWAYGEYQLEKMVDAIEAGIERRPARGESAQVFLNEAVPALGAVIEAEDGEGFEEAFGAFTGACMSCHVQEDVPFMVVRPPEHRISPIYAPDPPEGQ